MRSCREIRARIPLALDGSLPIEAVFEIEEHVRDCARCRARFESERTLDALLTRAPEPPIERVDVEAAVRAIRAATDATATPLPRRVPRWIPFAVAAAAAAAALLLLRARSTPEPESSPGIAAPELATPGIAPIVPPEAAPAVGPEAAPLDADRLAQTRDEVGRFLLSAASDLPSHADLTAARAFADRFDASALGIRRSNWPVLRLVEGFADDRDPALARAALRYLGLRGDRLSIRVVQGELARSDVAVEAALASCDAGDTGLEGLGAAMVDEDLRRVILARLAEDAGGTGAGIRRTNVARAVEGWAREEVARPDCLAALARLGAPGVASLLQLGSDGTISTLETLAALEHAPGAGEELANLALAGARGVDERLLLQALARLRPPRALPFVVERCQDPAHHTDALACLASYGGKEGLRRLLALRASWRFGDEELELPLLSTLARDREAGRELAEECIRGSRKGELRGMLALVLANPSDACAPALVALAGWDGATASDRRTCVLLAGEVGRAQDADALVTLFARTRPAERELRAACLVAIHELAGRDGATRALASASPRAAQRCLALLEERDARGKPLSTVIKIARELETALAPLSP